MSLKVVNMFTNLELIPSTKLKKYNVPYNPNRYCTSCRKWMPRDDGMQIVSNDGLRQRWVCELCKR